MPVTTGSAEVPRRAWVRAFLVSLGFLGIAVTASYAASGFIVARFPDRPMPRDLLLDALPYVGVAQYVADLTVILAVTIIAVHALVRAPRRLPPGIALFGVMYLMRAVLIVLTPLASPHNSVLFGVMPPQFGMWPSGHAANALLCVWLVDREQTPRLRWFMLALAVVEWISLLLSRGHYSIDIVGGLLLTYFIVDQWNRGRLFDPLKRLVEV